MDKPFDTKNLVERVKAKGLDLAEDMVEMLATEVFSWTEESLAIHPNTYVKFAIPVVQTVKPMIMEKIDNIDGKKG